MIIGFDFDGVGAIFGQSVRKSLLELSGIEVPDMTDEFCESWDFYTQWGMTREEFDKHVDAGVDAGIIFGNHPEFTRPNFFETVQRVKAMGHTVIGITHRYQGQPGNAERNTFEWIGEHIVHFDDVIFSADKTCVWTDMFVEDNKGNYDALIAAGTDAYLINRPWNGPYDDHRNRISDVKDFGDAVERVTKGLTMI